MKKSLNYKKMLFCTIVALLATNCGGGGGGGGSSATVIPSNPSVNKEPGKGNNGSIIIEDLPQGEKSAIIKDPVKAEEINIPKELGDGIKVAILDSDFLTHKAELEKKYKGIEILEKMSENPKPNGSKHGELVLGVLGEGKEKQFHIIASSIGEKANGTGDNIIKPNIKLYEEIRKRFEGQNVKIINQSWGINNEEDIKKLEKYTINLDPLTIIVEGVSKLSEFENQAIARGQAYVDFYKDMVNNENALFIWANGNYGSDRKQLVWGSLQAQLPNKVSDLKKGWISVIGVKPREEKSLLGGTGYTENVHYNEHLAWPGGTAWWAISASAENLDPNDITYGSSYAAPRVTRAAALVAAQYDWMTNSQIKQTLLTTTDTAAIEYNASGEPIYEYQKDKRYLGYVPDNKYGWGVLNTERAVGGPGGFIEKLIGGSLKQVSDGHYTVFKANVPEGTSSEFINDIRGDAGLVKQGTGRLILKGKNTYGAPTFVEDGVLEVYKTQKSDINVEKPGTLILHDGASVGYEDDPYNFTANLTNEGRVELIDENSTATVNGNYTTTKDAVTFLKFGSKLDVKGTTTLSEGAKIEVKSNYASAATEKKDLIVSNKIEGDLTKVEVTSEGAKTPKLSQAGNNVIVEMARQNMVEYAAKDSSATKSNLNVAANLESLMQDMDRKIEAGTATISELATLGAIQELSTTAINKKAEKLSGEIYASAQNLTFKQASSVNRNLSNHLGDLKSFRDSNYEWQGWTSGILSDGKIEKSGYAKADTKLQGGAFGLDKKIDPKTQVGVGIDYSYAKADFDKYAGKFNSDGVGVSLYGKKYLANDYYVLGRVGLSKYSTRVSRGILDKDLNTVGNGDIKHHDKMISTYVEAGKHFANFTPFVGYSYDNLRRGSFGENNGSWGIVADAKNYTKNSILLGVRSEYEVDSYTLNGHLTHAINLGDRSLDFDGRFAGSSTNVKFKGIEQTKTTTWVGVGLSKDLTKEIRLNTNLDFKFDNQKNTESLFTVGVNYKF